jgi:hypothetical protein
LAAGSGVAAGAGASATTAGRDAALAHHGRDVAGAGEFLAAGVFGAFLDRAGGRFDHAAIGHGFGTGGLVGDVPHPAHEGGEQREQAETEADELRNIETARVLVFLVGFEPGQAVGAGKIKLVAELSGAVVQFLVFGIDHREPPAGKSHRFDSLDAQHGETIADHLPDCCPEEKPCRGQLRVLFHDEPLFGRSLPRFQ